MAKKPDGKPASVDRVSFTRPAAERIGKAVRQVEAGNRDLGPLEWGPRGGGGAGGKVFRVGTATGEWPVDTPKTVTFYDVTTSPNTVSVLNQIVSLPAPKSTATSRIVNIAKDGSQWYLVSFQMSSKTAVMATATQTITFIGTAATQTMTLINAGATQTISYASAGADVAVLTDVAAVLNTSNCSISITKTTATLKTVGAPQTATVVDLSGTQTATIVSMSGTQTLVITTGTYTATFFSLEI
jgi:hypothetical protein